MCLRLERAEGPKATDVAIPVDTAPGEIAQVDFGYAKKRYDPERGILRKSWIFVMTLGYSRRSFCALVFDQKIQTWIRLLPGRGCDNAFGSSGGLLSASGVASIAADSFVLTATGLSANGATLFVQGDASASATFGSGVRCVGGTFLALYSKPASSGASSAPVGNQPSISARAAALGAPIPAGATRYYQVQYDDLGMSFQCGPSSSINLTQGLRVTWFP